VTNIELSMQFFLQLAFILGVCRLVGLVARRLGQPQVVAEMVAGVVMGPSIFGALIPGLQGHLFPRASMATLYAVSQMGLVLYMFLIGLEFDTNLIRKRLRSAASVSAAGIILPFSVGGLLAMMIVRSGKFFSPGVGEWQAASFMGAAMSITAFPMLARIIHECRLSGTSLGTLALTAGSIDDSASWCIFAIVLASFSGSTSIAIVAIGGGVLYVIFTLLVLKRLLAKLEHLAARNEWISSHILPHALILLMLCAWYTDRIGIHAVFGAFILGLAMPRALFAPELHRRMEAVVINLLLPLYFVYSGLNTRMGLLDSAEMWALAGAVLLVACFGKGVGCWMAARIGGEKPREALALGTLMNTRGLMELIILNIGLERGIITPALFTIMVMMAIATTLMASPIFEWVYRRQPRTDVAIAGLKSAIEPAPLFSTRHAAE
jgi:Kef-type K+ transport system membrane component KefB